MEINYMLQNVNMASIGTKTALNSTKMLRHAAPAVAIIANEVVKAKQKFVKNEAMNKDFKVLDDMRNSCILNFKNTQTPKEVVANYEKAANQFSLNDNNFDKLLNEENEGNRKVGLMKGLSKFTQKMMNIGRQTI